MLPPILMHILDGLAFSELFFVKKVTLPWSNHIFKIQWEIHFLTFLNTDRNAPKKIFRIEIWTFSFQICFKNQFSTLCIFRFTTSQSQKLTFKTDLK